MRRSDHICWEISIDVLEIWLDMDSRVVIPFSELNCVERTGSDCVYIIL